MCFFCLVSMSGKLVEYSSHAVKLLLSWIPHAFRWMPRAIHSESHNSQTKCFDQFAIFGNSVAESFPFECMAFPSFLKWRLPRKKHFFFWTYGTRPSTNIILLFLWKSWKRFRSGFNLRERVDKKETSRKFCYKLVMRYTELRLTFDSSINLLLQCSVIPVIEMTS